LISPDSGLERWPPASAPLISCIAFVSVAAGFGWTHLLIVEAGIRRIHERLTVISRVNLRNVVTRNCCHPPQSCRFELHYQLIEHIDLSLIILIKYTLSGSDMVSFAGSSKIKSKVKPSEKRGFNAQAFLDSAGVARRVVGYRKSQIIYSQGAAATNVMYIQKGGVKLSVLNESGKEAVVAILGPGDFLGEGCLAGQPVCMATATAIAPTSILFIEKKEMMRLLHEEHALSDRFISYMLGRNIRIEEDLIDQLFNSSEKRLARTLLLLARYGKQGQPQKILPNVSQRMLAEMIGTTRSRVNFFMNKFRKLGFIHYNGGLQVHNSLLSVVLHE
jgi:CRP/FNR family cyclic AMP-dependent transcriptional regulator